MDEIGTTLAIHIRIETKIGGKPTGKFYPLGPRVVPDGADDSRVGQRLTAESSISRTLSVRLWTVNGF
jgi:hypothetical protein